MCSIPAPIRRRFAARTATLVYRGTRTLLIRRTRWHEFGTNYWSITVENQTQGERYNGPVWRFTTPASDVPVDSVDIVNGDFGYQQQVPVRVFCQTGELITGNNYRAFLSWQLVNLPSALRLAGARWLLSSTVASQDSLAGGVNVYASNNGPSCGFRVNGTPDFSLPLAVGTPVESTHDDVQRRRPHRPHRSCGPTRRAVRILPHHAEAGALHLAVRLRDRLPAEAPALVLPPALDSGARRTGPRWPRGPPGCDRSPRVDATRAQGRPPQRPSRRLVRGGVRVASWPRRRGPRPRARGCLRSTRCGCGARRRSPASGPPPPIRWAAGTRRPTRIVGRFARRMLRAMGPRDLLQAHAIVPVLDSLGLDVDVAVDPAQPTFALVMVRNPFRFTAHAIGFLYWTKVEDFRMQGAEFQGGNGPADAGVVDREVRTVPTSGRCSSISAGRRRCTSRCSASPPAAPTGT
jgi:hypothetical protein